MGKATKQTGKHASATKAKKPAGGKAKGKELSAEQLEAVTGGTTPGDPKGTLGAVNHNTVLRTTWR